MSLVLWSGGCDSTLMLHELLKNSSACWPVRALTIIHDQVSPTKQPARARKKAKYYWKKKGYHLEHTEIEINRVDSNWDVQAINNGGLAQPVFWLTFAIPYLNEKEDLYFGYIKEDCIWHHKSEFQEGFKYLSRMCCKQGKLRTPFALAHKRSIIKRLKESDDLYKRTWWCERNDNINKVCGKCLPCELHRTAKWQIEQGIGKDESLPGVFY